MASNQQQVAKQAAVNAQKADVFDWPNLCWDMRWEIMKNLSAEDRLSMAYCSKENLAFHHLRCGIKPIELEIKETDGVVRVKLNFINKIRQNRTVIVDFKREGRKRCADGKMKQFFGRKIVSEGEVVNTEATWRQLKGSHWDAVVGSLRRQLKYVKRPYKFKIKLELDLFPRQLHKFIDERCKWCPFEVRMNASVFCSFFDIMKDHINNQPVRFLRHREHFAIPAYFFRSSYAKYIRKFHCSCPTELRNGEFVALDIDEMLVESAHITQQAIVMKIKMLFDLGQKNFKKFVVRAHQPIIPEPKDDFSLVRDYIMRQFSFEVSPNSPDDYYMEMPDGTFSKLSFFPRTGGLSFEMGLTERE